MKNHCATIVLVLLIIFIFCFNSYATAQVGDKDKGMPWLSLLLKPDKPDFSAEFSVYFSKIPRSSIIIINNSYKSGSSFSLEITNNSTRTFRLKRWELRNGASIIDYTTDQSLLSGGQLTSDESLNLGFTITEDLPDQGVKAIYYLVDPITGKPFTVSYEW